VENAKRKRLEAAGWKVGDAADFLRLSDEEVELVEVKLALSDYMRELRRRSRLTQARVAERIGSSQSRIAKMEAAEASVSLDLLVKALFSLGASVGDVGRVIASTADEIALLRDIRVADQQIARGEVIPHEEVVARQRTKLMG
jgi:transcriptional regulator with XRE-family HTH domain